MYQSVVAGVTVTFVILSYNYIIQCQSNSVPRLAPVYQTQQTQQTQQTDDGLITTGLTVTPCRGYLVWTLL